jgi:DNA polymerase III subunit epsilon
MEFVAIDVETANPDMSSICQIGIALFQGEQLLEQWKTYVNPELNFYDKYTLIHGISEDLVADAPRIPEISCVVNKFLNNRISVCHTHFDRFAVKRAYKRYGLEFPKCQWVDSLHVARRTWDQLSGCGYSLGNVCNFLGYNFKWHDALEDAKASGYILLEAIKKTGIDLDGWLEFGGNEIIDFKSSSKWISSERVRREGNPLGPLYGEVIVFTGDLQISRTEAADIASHLGCRVDSGVTKRTTILVIGDQDITKLAGHLKSSKQRKAEEYISRGQKIAILYERDFMQLEK